MIQELESRSITEWVVVPQSAINWEEADSNDIYITIMLSTFHLNKYCCGIGEKASAN